MWDKRFGGTDQDYISSIIQTADGGYILGGQSWSPISGDKTQNTWGGVLDPDYWIVKTDSLGNKQWDKDFGGDTTEYLRSVQQTADGGYILGGYSYSGISGDKTQNTWGGVGDPDFWIVKTDSLGNKQWDKDFGGTAIDEFYYIQQTTDGGYILGGWSYSGISGDKTQNTWGFQDFWIVKTDSLGNKQWDKDFGGIYGDQLYSMQQTVDGGYILGGFSGSPISGDKTQDRWGATDYWIVKIDSLGNKEWDKDFGGTDFEFFYSIKQTVDGGYILGGWSASPISGDKTQSCWGGVGDRDYWILKTDSLGYKQWDKDFGGTIDEDGFGNISLTTDGGYLIAGTSYSPISGNKTEANLGNEQTWVLKTDSIGNLLWDKTLHTITPGDDEIGFALQTRDGCYVMANWTDGGIGGDKSQPAWNNTWDYWLIKFCDSTFIQANLTATQNLCPGTCIDFLNLSFNASSYQWSFPGATPDTSTAINPTNICYANPGNYDVQLIATNANGSDTLLLTNYITVYPTPPPQSITQSGDTLFAIAGAATYQWYFNGNLISGATDYFYVASASGDYNVVVTDENGCEVEAAIFNVVAGLQSTVDSQQLMVFPNPVKDKLTMHSRWLSGARCTIGTAVDVSIYNLVGEKVFSARDYTLETIDCRLFPAGLYYLEIKYGSKIYRNKFVK